MPERRSRHARSAAGRATEGARSRPADTRCPGLSRRRVRATRLKAIRATYGALPLASHALAGGRGTSRTGARGRARRARGETAERQRLARARVIAALARAARDARGVAVRGAIRALVAGRVGRGARHASRAACRRWRAFARRTPVADEPRPTIGAAGRLAGREIRTRRADRAVAQLGASRAVRVVVARGAWPAAGIDHQDVRAHRARGGRDDEDP